MTSVVDVPRAKKYLNLSDPSNDALVQQYLDGAEAAIAARVGPLQPVSKSVRVRGGGYSLVLPDVPVVDVTSVTPSDGAAVLDVAGDLYVDTAAGVITYNLGYLFVARHYDVVYRAGRATCPEDLITAVLELTRHMWSTTQRAGGGKPGTQPSESTATTVPGAAYLFPIRVEQLLVMHETPGFA